MSVPRLRPEPHVGASVRVLGVGEGRIIGRADLNHKWTIELDQPSTYPSDHGRRYITRTAGEFNVIDRHSEETPA